MTVMAATRWASNAEMIEACAELGYLKYTDAVIDPTYGRGTWWKKWRPSVLVGSDLRDEFAVDFRDLPHGTDVFDAAAYDPPYVCVGGRATTGTAEMHDRYGMTDAPRTPIGLQRLINDGLQECARVVKPGGYVLCKCQDYVSSGRLWIGTHHTLTFGLSIGLELVDRLEMVTSPRPQPPGRRQVHARRNLSTLFVFKVPKKGAR